MSEQPVLGQAQRGVIAALLSLAFVIAVADGLSLQQPSSPAQNIRPPVTRTEQSQGDKNIDRGMAADDWLALFTLALVFVGGFQVRLFWVQLRLIGESLVDAKKAADAAEGAASAANKQAKITEESFAKLERPWIFVRLHPFLKDNPADATNTIRAIEDGLAYPVAARDPPDRIPLAIFDISNHGRMPGVITDCHILLEPVEVTANGPQIGFGFIRDDVHGPVGPGETRADLSVDCPGGVEYGVLVDIVTGESRPIPTGTPKHIFVFRAVIAYRDVARDVHVSSFCWRFDDGMGYWVQHGGDEYNYQT